jgi:hypothetical protein
MTIDGRHGVASLAKHTITATSTDTRRIAREPRTKAVPTRRLPRSIRGSPFENEATLR